MVVKEENVKFILGLKVKLHRKRNQLSQTDLATKANVSVSYLNEIESGKKYPKREKIFLLADALNTTYNELVSIELEKSLSPLTEILTSNLLSRIPLDDFGIDTGKIFDVFSAAPVRSSAFINTFFEMVRHYNISIHDYYLSSLRSYLEMKKNFFDDVEKEAETRLKQSFQKKDVSIESLKRILTNEFSYEIMMDSFNSQKEFKSIRSFFCEKGNRKILLLNEKLSKEQIVFSLSRELGYCVLNITQRSQTYPQLIKSEDFDEGLNNYKARYFASALIMPMEKTADHLKKFFSLKKWSPVMFSKLLSLYPVTAETFLHRITSILPKKFDINSLFFLKIYNDETTNKYDLVKELHLGGLQRPHETSTKQHYCRRWISIESLDMLKKSNGKNSQQQLPYAQYSDYHRSDRSYLCISIARPTYPIAGKNSSLTIGVEDNESLKDKILFARDPSIKRKMVGVTCEQCMVKNCKERVAEKQIPIDEDNHEIASLLHAYAEKKYLL